MKLDMDMKLRIAASLARASGQSIDTVAFRALDFYKRTAAMAKLAKRNPAGLNARERDEQRRYLITSQDTFKDAEASFTVDHAPFKATLAFANGATYEITGASE